MKQIKPVEPISSESLSKKVIRGGIWVFSLHIIEPFWFLTAIIIMIPTIESGEVKADVPVKG